MGSQEFAVVGGGINGLMVAYELSNTVDSHCITVYDEGPNPHVAGSTLFQGSTYNGLNARHVSALESKPLSSLGRASMLGKSAAYGGWNLLADTALTAVEDAWLQSSYSQAQNSADYTNDRKLLTSLNHSGLRAWNDLAAKQEDIFKPAFTGRIVVMSDSPTRLSNYLAEESKLFLSDIVEPTTGRESVLALPSSVTVEGSTYASQDIAKRLISYLETKGVNFLWQRRIDSTSPDEIPIQDSHVVLCNGIGSTPSLILEKLGISLQGIVGCWLMMDNPGYSQPFKVLGEDPISYINCTPSRDKLLISGGYGWLGQRALVNSSHLVAPLALAFKSRVNEIFQASDNAADLTTDDISFCVRPTTPNGMPVLASYDSPNKNSLIVNVGHASAGFTQAPYLAKKIVQKLVGYT